MDSKREVRIQRLFGERMRELRKQRGLSQEALALACNLDRTYIGSVERGERNVSLINIQTIADGLSVPARELFNADPIPGELLERIRAVTNMPAGALAKTL
jgi:transcriptional regulator with XRE-family HTH domain